VELLQRSFDLGVQPDIHLRVPKRVRLLATVAMSKTIAVHHSCPQQAPLTIALFMSPQFAEAETPKVILDVFFPFDEFRFSEKRQFMIPVDHCLIRMQNNPGSSDRLRLNMAYVL